VRPWETNSEEGLRASHKQHKAFIFVATEVVRAVSLERVQNRRKGESICNTSEVRLVPESWQLPGLGRGEHCGACGTSQVDLVEDKRGKGIKQQVKRGQENTCQWRKSSGYKGT